MALLTYGMIASLDGYIEDETGSFDWAEPHPDAMAFINDRDRVVGTCLYGRRLYETMQVWETDPSLATYSEAMADYAAIWQAADKVVYSTTLDAAATSRTRIERTFDPDQVRRLKASTDHEITIGGAQLAAHAFRAGLIDEVHLYVVPAIVGGGKRALPDGVRLDLELVDHQRLPGGMIYLHHRSR